MREQMISKISFNLHVLKDEYLQNKTRYQETKGVLMVYFQIIIDSDQK